MLTDDERHERKLARQRAYNKKTKYASTLKAQKENTIRITVPMHKVNDADVIAKLESVDNKAGYIKSLIRRDIENSD